MYWTKYNFEFNFFYFLSIFYFLYSFVNIQKNMKILFCKQLLELFKLLYLYRKKM